MFKTAWFRISLSLALLCVLSGSVHAGSKPAKPVTSAPPPDKVTLLHRELENAKRELESQGNVALAGRTEAEQLATRRKQALATLAARRRDFDARVRKGAQAAKKDPAAARSEYAEAGETGNELLQGTASLRATEASLAQSVTSAAEGAAGAKAAAERGRLAITHLKAVAADNAKKVRQELTTARSTATKARSAKALVGSDAARASRRAAAEKQDAELNRKLDLLDQRLTAAGSPPAQPATGPIPSARSLVGKFAWTVVRDREVDRRLRALLGKAYQDLVVRLEVGGALVEEDGYVVGQGSKPHSGPTDLAVVAIGLAGGDLHVAIFGSELAAKQKTYGTPGFAPPKAFTRRVADAAVNFRKATGR